ncbi:ABC transporter ATP-binding protein [Nocardioides ginsengisoli]|uniref:ABC transporter ATP-binding protein n=1 Tax=Nocardioides ginsengisoli TaxID=363868 RepID=A0ABW3W4Q9_9ACTN
MTSHLMESENSRMAQAEGKSERGRLLEVKDLNVTAGPLELVTSVDFQLRRGERLGLVGETGSGKSLTCRAVMGALERKGLSATGSVTFDGVDMARMAPAAKRKLLGREIGFVPQSSLNSLNPVMRVGRQLAEAVEHLGCPRRDVDARVRELLAAVELRDVERVLRAYPHQLSGGMRQRVMIALGIAGRPQLLVADEPTTALDVTVQRRLLTLLVELCDAEGMALLLVTHDLGVVQEVCDSVLVMYAGQAMESGPVKEVFARPSHPYTRALLAARPSSASAAGAGARLLGLPGRPPAPGTWDVGCRFAPRCELRVDACTAGSIDLRAEDDGHLLRCVHASGEGRSRHA